MIKQIITRLKEYGLFNYVLTDHNLDDLLTNIVKPDHCTYFEDVRSATFFAFGQSKLQGKPSVLIVDDDFISNCYTALIETWMQRIPLIIISYNSRKLSSIQYLQRCLDAVYEINDKDNIDTTSSKWSSINGPILIRVFCDYNKNGAFSYADVLKQLTKRVTLERILCYNINPDEAAEYGVENIEKKYKYGIISKYVGRLMSGNSSVLVIPDFILELESNIFNVRNLPSTFRVYIKKTSDKIIDNYTQWLKSNNIEVKRFDDFNDEEKIPSMIIF